MSSRETTASNFFVMCHEYTSKAELKIKGIAEYVVGDIPLKPPLLATIKSNNYLINALACESAEDMVRRAPRVAWGGGTETTRLSLDRHSAYSLPHPHKSHQGGFLGIQLDERGCLAESSIANVAVLTPQGVLRTPPFGKILAGTTVKRLWELAGEMLVAQGM